MKIQMKIQNIASGLILTGASLWGILGLFVRELSRNGFTDLQTVMCRAFVVTLILFLYLMIFDRQKLKINIRDLWMFLGTGVLSIAFFNLCYFYSIHEMSLSAACIFLYTAPGFVMFLSAVLFKEKITGQKMISLLLAFTGCVFISGMIGSGTRISVIGIIVGLGSGFFYSLYSIFGKIASARYSSETVVFYTFLFAFLATMVFGNPIKTMEMTLGNGRIILHILLLGIVSSFLPYFLYTAGLKYVEPGRASIMATAEPLVATLCGIIIYHEEITLYNGLGIGCILMSVILLNVRKKTHYEFT